MRGFLSNPVVAAVSVVVLLAGLGIATGLVITRQTGSYAAGVIASNLGMILGLVMGYKVYRSERRE